MTSPPPPAARVAPPRAAWAAAAWAAAGVAACAAAYTLLHHARELPVGGAAGAGTRWVDWLSLLASYAVAGVPLVALAAARTDRRGWALALSGALAYVHGHGIHLAANSIGAERGDVAPVRLWDEVVGHGYAYAGLALLAVAVLRRVRAGAAAPTASPARPIAPLLAAAAVGMVVTHWLRLAPLGYRAPGSTRWEDFVDLATPWAVAGPALLVLARVAAPRRLWVPALVGTAVFAQGHGLHLSANSITWASGPADPAYLWDEEVGHALWFLGLVLLLVVVVEAVRDRPVRTGATATGLAVLVGLTWAANVVEAGHAPLGSVLAVALVVHGCRTRSQPAGRLVALAFAIGLAGTAAYGLWQGGFPQPSELGWL